MGGTTVTHKIGYKTIVRSSQNADLQKRLFAVYSGDEEAESLADLAAGLLEWQKKTWPGLAEGYAALDKRRHIQMKVIGHQAICAQGNKRIRVLFSRLSLEKVDTSDCFGHTNGILVIQ